MKCKYYKPYMDTLRSIVGEYYQLDGGNCCTGGPLHIMLDDGNYSVNHVQYCMQECFSGLIDPESSFTGDHSKETLILGIMICNEYAKMSLEERAVFNSYICGHRLDCCGDCNKCPRLGDDYEFNKECEEDHYRKMEERKGNDQIRKYTGCRLGACDQRDEKS